MQQRTADLIAHLNHYREILRRAVEDVPSGQRVVKPGPDRWSVAEVLEHLVIVETRIGGLFAKGADANRSATPGVQPGSGQSGGRGAGAPLAVASTDTIRTATIDVKAIVDRSTRLVAGETSRPSGTMTAEEALDRLDVERQKLKAALAAADDLELGDTVVSHPRLGPLNLYQWVLFLGGHEGRHAEQIREAAGTDSEKI